MSHKHALILALAVVISLAIGGTAGFFLGVISTRAGQELMKDLVETEKAPATAHPKKLVRPQFQLQYPSNWRIADEDEDYDPDQMFSIESPGSSFVMFVLGRGESDPEESLAHQVSSFGELLNGMTMEPFEGYGSLRGKGAILKGRAFGIRTTTRVFSARSNGLTLMITEQAPDEDLPQVKTGFELIENSFKLKASQ